MSLLIFLKNSVPCWVCNIPHQEKQTPGVFWGDMARWFHNDSDYSKMSQSHSLLEFSVFVPHSNLDLSQCLSALPLHKAPSSSQKKHSLAMTKSLLCWGLHYLPVDSPGGQTTIHATGWSWKFSQPHLTTSPFYAPRSWESLNSLVSEKGFKAATWQHQSSQIELCG